MSKIFLSYKDVKYFPDIERMSMNVLNELNNSTNMILNNSNINTLLESHPIIKLDDFRILNNILEAEHKNDLI